MDVRAGQDLVLRLYDALVHSPLWEKTLLVVTYDEHGGFYDHVSPPAAQDDSPKFRTYGLRVPTLVISPWVDQGMVSNSVFDHTSIIKSILLRFCQSNDRSIPDLGTRVNAANHLGSLLVRATPRQANSFANDEPLIEWVGDWKKTAFKAHLSQDARTKRITPPPLTEFQRGLRATKRRLVADGAVKSF